MSTSPNPLVVPALMDVTFLQVVGSPVMVVLGVEKPLPQNGGLVRLLGFLAPAVLQHVAMLIQKPYIERGYRSILLAA